MEKNMKRNIYIYICITESLCCVAKIKACYQLYFNKIKKKIELTYGSTIPLLGIYPEGLKAGS